MAIGPCQFCFIHVALNGELMVKLISKTYAETEDLVALISDQLLTNRPTHNTLPAPTSSSMQICSTVPACSTVVTCSTMPMDEAVACSTVATSGTVPVDEATASTVATCGDAPIDGITACTMAIDAQPPYILEDKIFKNEMKHWTDDAIESGMHVQTYPTNRRSNN